MSSPSDSVTLEDYPIHTLDAFMAQFSDVCQRHENPPGHPLYQEGDDYVLENARLSYEKMSLIFKKRLSHLSPLFENAFFTQDPEMRQKRHDQLCKNGEDANEKDAFGCTPETYISLLSRSDQVSSVENLSVINPTTQKLEMINSSIKYQAAMETYYHRKVIYQSQFSVDQPVLWLLHAYLPKVDASILNSFYHIYRQMRYGIVTRGSETLPHLAIIPEPSCGLGGVGLATIDKIAQGSLVRAYVSHLRIPELKMKDMAYRFIHQSRFGIIVDAQPEAAAGCEFKGNEALLINTAPKAQINLCRETFLWRGLPITGLFALRDIEPGEQLAYAYSADASKKCFSDGTLIKPLEGLLKRV